MTALYSSGSKGIVPWEQNRSWPWPNMIFNVTVGERAQTRLNSKSQAPHLRGTTALQQRGVPQLTWFRGKYEQWGDDKNGEVVKCNYPNLLSPMKNYRRKCLVPGQDTPAEIAAAQAEKDRREALVGKEIVSQNPKDICSQGMKLTKGGKEHTVYFTGYPRKYFSCQTNELIAEDSPQVVRGLGAPEAPSAPLTKAEQKAHEARKSLYTTTELTLAAGLLAAAYLIWKK